MKLKFETPQTPNFIRCTNTTILIPLQDLTEEELTEYADLWCDTLKKNYEQKKVKR